MNRQTALLTTLGLVLVLVLFYLFGWAPKSEELATVNDEIDAAVSMQSQLEAQIRDLEGVRATAPELEAAIAAASSLVPREAALPAALRQLQQAADDSGVDLTSIAPGRPAAVAESPELASIALSISAEGSYFQLVDFLRRVEDPAITPRVALFDNLSVSLAEYPTLSVSLSGSMYALLPAPPVVGEEDDAADVDVEIDVAPPADADDEGAAA